MFETAKGVRQKRSRWQKKHKREECRRKRNNVKKKETGRAKS